MNETQLEYQIRLWRYRVYEDGSKETYRPSLSTTIRMEDVDSGISKKDEADIVSRVMDAMKCYLLEEIER